MRGIIPVALLAAMPLAVSAQDAPAPVEDVEVQQCVAELAPAAIDASEGAVQHFTARLSEDIGEITGVEAPTESGLVIASPDELTEMASDEGEEAASEMADMATEGFSAALWLSAKDATPGTYEIVLQGENGACATQITVEGEEEAGN